MREIPLYGGAIAIIDDVDYENVSRYHWILHDGYAQSRQGKNTIHMGRLILNCPVGMEVDHINHDKLDNRRANLRIVTRSQNCANRRSFKNATSQYKGVSWNKQTHCWMANIKKDGEQFYLGMFDDEIAAANAYNDYARKLWGEYAVLNDVEECDYRRKQRRARKWPVTEFKGVTLKPSGRWQAAIRVSGKRMNLGTFDSVAEAAVAYNKAYEAKYGKKGPNVI